MIASWPASTNALAEQRSHIRRSRSGLTNSSAMLFVDVTLAQHDAGEHRPDERVHGERGERRVNAAERDDDRRQRQRAREAADRDRRLADPEREPALVGGEPVHHRASARGVDRGAERARRDECGDERRELVRRSPRPRARAPHP